MIGGGGRGHVFRSHPFHHRFHRDVFFFGFGASAFYPAWWWYDPYYYWGPPPGYYSDYYGYPYYGYYDYPYYGYYDSPYWSDPCLSSDPAYAPYCQPGGSPYQGAYGTAPVEYPLPAAPTLPESGTQSPPPPAPGQPAPSGN